MTYKEFSFSVKRMLAATLSGSGKTLEELSVMTGYSVHRLNALIYGKENLFINDIFIIARAFELRADITLLDASTGEAVAATLDKEILYSDFSLYDDIISDLKLKMLNCHDGELDYYRTEISILEKNRKNYSSLRFFIWQKIEKRMHSLEITLSDLASMINVTEYYLMGVSAGAENLSLEFLYRVMNALHATFSITLVPIWEGDGQISVSE